MSEEDNLNHSTIKRFSVLEHVSKEFIKICSDEAFIRSNMLTKLEAALDEETVNGGKAGEPREQ